MGSHRLALPDDDDLLDELANLRVRESAPGVYRVDHDPDKHDDRAIALALAVQASLAYNPAPSPCSGSRGTALRTATRAKTTSASSQPATARTGS
jgi:hypothetical protein